MFDVIIVGAGPAGLFAAQEFSNSNLRVMVIDQGKPPQKRTCSPKNNRCNDCNPCSIMSGIGGAGGFSDGKLNLSLYTALFVPFTKNKKEAKQVMQKIISSFEEFDTQNNYVFPSKEQINKIKKLAETVQIKYLPIMQKHIGSDQIRIIFSKFYENLAKKGINFTLNKKVDSFIVKNNKVLGVKIGEQEIKSKFVLACPGRAGSQWFFDAGKKEGVKFKPINLDFGVRVEAKNNVFENITKINYDPKFFVKTETGTIRTFCTNPSGFVVMENNMNIVCVNGHAFREKKSKNTNVALLYRKKSPSVSETIKHYNHFKSLPYFQKKTPIIQRLGDLKKQEITTKEKIKNNSVKPTLNTFSFGDINLIYPKQVIEDIINAIKKLNNVFPGLNENDTIVYAPEIKFYSLKTIVKKNLETNVENLFAAGDGAGLTRCIISASGTGIIAARRIIEKSKKTLKTT
ncbi:MAG: NAD(P)/FAD-dependent oxidoreductase [archaeon]